MSYRRVFIFVSTEDDRYLIKGGIATYLGTLLPEASRRHPECLFIWVTESPYLHSFCEIEGNVERYYLNRIIGGERWPIETFASQIENFVELKIAELKSKNPGVKFFLESPDWEGLSAELFERLSDPSVLKITRCHGPMANCFLDNNVPRTSSAIAQHHREQRQAKASDLVSCPSQFIFDRLESAVLEGQKSPAPHVIFGNSVASRNFGPGLVSRERALGLLKEKFGVDLTKARQTIFQVGSLEPRKGTFLIARALNKILAELKEAHFCFIGLFRVNQSDSISSNSIKLSREQVLELIDPAFHDRVHFTGVVPHNELPAIVHGADLHLVCYLADNFPGVLTEIAVSRLPMVTALKGGIPDMITADGEILASGVAGESEAELVQSIERQVLAHFENPSVGHAKAERLRRHVLESYSPERIVGKYFEHYEHYLSLKAK